MVVQEPQIVVARRAYEFHPDNLQLPMLSLAQTLDRIRGHFRFQSAQVAKPIEIFGPVADDIPPGVVFDLGGVSSPQEPTTPIRFVHFESTRIVVDAAGPTSAIDTLFEQLHRILAPVRTTDGLPAIGEPSKVLDYSEIAVRLGFELGELINEAFLNLAQRTFDAEAAEGSVTIPLGLKFGGIGPSDMANPALIGAFRYSRGQVLEVRAGTHPKDKIYYSAAELPTDQHLAWLKALDEIMSPSSNEP